MDFYLTKDGIKNERTKDAMLRFHNHENMPVFLSAQDQTDIPTIVYNDREFKLYKNN